MRSVSWLCVIISLALFLEVRCAYRYVEYFAEKNCKRYEDDSIEYRLSPSGRYSAAIIRATSLLSYSYPFNCNITVTVSNSDDKKVLLSVRKVSFPSRTHCVNYIKIYEKKKSYKLCVKHDIPGKKLDFSNDGNSMKFLYHTESYTGVTFGTDDDFFSTGFEMLATAYTKAPCGKDLDFLCKNGRCISQDLRFDGYDNCGDGSDEEWFNVSIRLPLGAIVGICFAILLTIAAVFVIVFLVRRRGTTRTTYAPASQPLYSTGHAPYPQQTFAPFPPYPQAPADRSQYGALGNPNYREQPPPYQ